MKVCARFKDFFSQAVQENGKRVRTQKQDVAGANPSVDRHETLPSRLMQRFGSSSAAARRAEGATAAAGRGAGYREGVCGGRWALHLSNIRWCHGHRQTGPKSILWTWSPTTKQPSGLRLQNEYDPRPVSAGTEPSF